ncbi:hypothetical protein AAG570_001091 [Ranatra chinensis]|uniref:Uncharacterized protein n=1 Tax=Ranatra chinensis TaxID=642074 RepID=A0ABD0YAV1_9HEMI
MSDIMEDPELYLLFRFSMDDVSFPVVSAAVNAMSNLIVNNTDETCLDLMLGMPQALHQPSFEIDLGMSESDIGELKDKELLKVDIIRGAIRTQLIDRISYIMCELRPEPLDIKHMLKCLTRIARHSAEAARQVVSCPGLLGAVHSLLMHSSGSTSYYPEALKFLRVLICRSSALADIIVNDHSVLGTIFTFIAGEVGAGHPELMHVTLESFYTWQSVLTYRMHTDSISSFTPVLMRFLEAHLGLTLATGSSGSDLEHAAAILSLLTPIARFGLLDLLRPLLPAVVQCTVKWLTQLLNADRILVNRIVAIIYPIKLKFCFIIIATFFNLVTNLQADWSSSVSYGSNSGRHQYRKFTVVTLLNTSV